MRYYLKKCQFQELGSVMDGRPNRGRYLLTSKNPEVLGMFPPLSVTQLNDCALIPIIPLYSNKKIYCNFVYHNDKYHNSVAKHPRDEYRIYLNKALEENQLMFSQNDIVIMRTGKIDDDENSQTVYLLDVVKNIKTALYEKLDNIISNYPINGGYGLYDGEIAEFEEKVKNIHGIQKCVVEIDDTVTQKITPNHSGINDDVLANLFNLASFRDFVMVGYENLCAISGTVIKYESYMNLEAAHIKPKSHGGLFLPNNGLALCRDLHWAFDKGFFTLDDDLRVLVHSKISSEYLEKFNGKQIRIPKNDFFRPNLDNVRYHRENIFGRFLETGKL